MRTMISQQPSDLLAAALPKIPAPGRKFDPAMGSSAPKNSRDSRANLRGQIEGAGGGMLQIVNIENPNLSLRQRIELALPCALMIEWTETWKGMGDTSAMGEIYEAFIGDINLCMTGLDNRAPVKKINPALASRGVGIRPTREADQTVDITLRGKTKAAAKTELTRAWTTLTNLAVELIMPLKEGPAKCSPLTGFIACSFLWQQLIEDGKLELAEGSRFHRAWERMANLVIQKYGDEDLWKTRRAAIKRKDEMMKKLKDKGYYQS